MPRIVIEDLVEESFESAVVHDEQDTEWPVIQLVGRDVAGKVRQSPIEIRALHVAGGLFSPRPPASFGGWRREQKRDDLAINANWLVDRPTHPPPPTARPRKCRAEWSRTWAKPR